MCALNDFYPALIAICIVPMDIRYNRYHVVDMGHKMFPPTATLIRHSNQDPECRSEISYPGIGYLIMRLLRPPEIKMRTQVMRKYKPAYQGMQQNYTN